MKGWAKSWKSAVHKLKIDKAVHGIDKTVHKIEKAVHKKKKKQEPLPKLELAGGPKHTDILIARTEKEKRCIGGPEDSKRKIEWFRHIDENVVLIEGVNGGFYQPSIDDVGCVIECQISEKEMSSHTRTSTHITLDDGIATLAVETLSTIQAKKHVSFDANLVCTDGRDFVGSIPCRISLFGTSENEVILELLHTANVAAAEEEEIKVDIDDEEVIVETPISPLPKASKFEDGIIEKMMKVSGHRSRSHVIRALYNAKGRIQDAMLTLEKKEEEEKKSPLGSAILCRANLMNTNKILVKLDTREQQGNRFTLLCEESSGSTQQLQWPVVLSVPWPRDRDVLVLVLREIAEQPRNGTIDNLSSRAIPSTPLWRVSRDDEECDDDDNSNKDHDDQKKEEEDEEDLFVPEINDDENKIIKSKKENDEETLKAKPTFDPKLYVLKTSHERKTREKYESRIKVLTRQLDESQSRVRALIQESKNLKDELSSIVKERDNLAIKMQSALSGKKALQFQQTISKLRKDLDAAETRNREMKIKATEVKKSLKRENEEALRVLELKMCNERENSNEELRRKLEMTDEKLKISEMSRFKVEEKLKESVSKVTTLISQRNAAKQKAVSMKSELRHLLSQKMKADSKVKELREKISELQATNDTVKETRPLKYVDAQEEEEAQDVEEHVSASHRTPSSNRTTTTTPGSNSSSSSWLSRQIMRKSDNQMTQLRNLVNALSDQLHDKESVLDEKRMALRILAARVKELEGMLRDKQ